MEVGLYWRSIRINLRAAVLLWIFLVPSTCVLRKKTTGNQRNGPAAASQCKGMGQRQCAYSVKVKANSRRKIVRKCFGVVLWPVRARVRSSMAGSFCGPQLRADGAMAAQELNQLMGTVLEEPTKAVVAMQLLGFFREHQIHMALAHPRACL